MACYAPNTPSPTSSSQIGYSFIQLLNTATTISQNVLEDASTNITNIPVGVWSLSGNAQAVETSGNKSVNEATVKIETFVSAVYTTIYNGGMNLGSTTTNPTPTMYIPFNGVFYSDGTIGLRITLAIRSADTNICTNSGSIVLTKIA